MCCDGNSAPLSVRYLNAQLSALWENASKCAADCQHVSFRSSDYEKSKYTQALAQFHYSGKRALRSVGSTDDLLFHAKFTKPSLHFICNHEAVLSLWIGYGHLYADRSKAADPKYRIIKDKKHHLDTVNVVFRLPFSRSKIKGRDSKIGNANSKHLIQMLILNFEEAKMVLPGADSSIGFEVKEALEFYMLKYLAFLQQAGNHVLFDLPDFDDDKHRPKIDYSLWRSSESTIDLEEICAHVGIRGFDLETVNRFLHEKWMKVASITNPVDHLSVCLAEIRSNWLTNCVIDSQFCVRFGAPKIKALCSHEAILYFDIDDIAFFESSDWDIGIPARFRNWKIAFIVNFAEEKEGSITRIKLLLDTARYSEYFSTHITYDEHTETYYQLIVKFLTTDYLDILLQYSFHVIYTFDLNVVPFGFGGSDATSDSGSASWSESSNSENEGTIVRKHGQVRFWSEYIEKTSLFGFDHVLSITEDSINILFGSYRSRHECLRVWSQDSFKATFDALSVKLLTNGKAIVWVTMDEVQVSVRKPSEPGSWWKRPIEWLLPGKDEVTEIHTLHHVILAFEVDLKMVEHAHLEVSHTWHETFKDSNLWHCHHDVQQVIFKHLLLDFKNAHHIHELSSFDAGLGRVALDRQQTVLYQAHNYLKHLAGEGHNIIHSVPVFGQGSAVKFGFTSVNYQVVTKVDITVHTCNYKRAGSDSPIILILSMCNHRPMPTITLGWSTGWVIAINGKKAVGTACLSREAFLEGRLLSLLAGINGETTIVPKFAGVIDGQWHFDLTTWSRHEYRQGKACTWKSGKHTSAYLEYIWEHRDEWSHEHEGTYGDEPNGEYKLSCHTRNKVHIPTAYTPGKLEVVVKGESAVKVSGKSNHQKWSKKTIASWSASIFVYTRIGLSVEVIGDIKPIFSDADLEGVCPLDVQGLHAGHLPKSLNIGTLLTELKSILEGNWEFSAAGGYSYSLAHPIFTRSGDLIVQLVAPNPTSKEVISGTGNLSIEIRNGSASSFSSVATTPLKTPSDSILIQATPNIVNGKLAPPVTTNVFAGKDTGYKLGSDSGSDSEVEIEA